MIKVGIVGLGFMGRTHLAAYQAAAAAGHPCCVVATTQPGRDHGGDGIGVTGPPIRVHPTAEALLDDPAVDLVSICTYTDTHVRLAERALGAGKHVVIEKPVALEVEAIGRLVAASVASQRICLPAMCMRVWPGWRWLRDQIEARTYGSIRSARFERFGSRPGWGQAFYGNPARTGGALFDLHIHDADYVRWCFGDPVSVASIGTIDHLTTSYRYPDGPAVVAEGGWLTAPSTAFQMRFRIECDVAVIEFDLGRSPPVTVTDTGGTKAVSGLPEASAYELEICHALDLVSGRVTTPMATLEDAIAVTRLLHVEARSLALGTEVPVGRL